MTILKLIHPNCCEQQRKTPSIYLNVDDNSENPRWIVAAFTDTDNLKAKFNGSKLHEIHVHSDLYETRITALFCPFCGTKVPEIIRREDFKSKICKPNDGYCDTCTKRLSHCRCFPCEWNWQPKEVLNMSYAIGNIVYGLDASESSPFLELLKNWLEENQDSENEEISLFVDQVSDVESFQEHWCKQLYSANGPTSAFFGVKINTFDECNNITAIELKEKFLAKMSQIEEFNKKWEQLPEVLRKTITAKLEPEIFILWSSS